MFVRRSIVGATLVGTLAFSACGTSSDDAATQTSAAPSVTDAPVDATDDALTPSDAVDETAAPAETAPAESAPAESTPTGSVEPADTIVTDTGTVSPDTDATEPVDTAPPATDPPATTPATTTPPPAEVGGRTFAADLTDGSDIATNPLPDLQVDDIRRGAAVNLRNVFPADRPVLVWMWAPH